MADVDTEGGTTLAGMIAGPTGRRQFLAKAGIGAVAAYAAPAIISSPAAAQGGSGAIPVVVVGSNDSGRTFTSTDAGLLWPIDATPVSSGEVHSVAYSPASDKWIGVGRDLDTGGTVILTSTDDGASWSGIPGGPTGRLLDVATDGAGNWVTVGESITTFPGEPYLQYSPDDGVTWFDASIPVLTTSINSLHGVATDGGTWIASGQNDAVEGIILISTDSGVTWSDPIVLATRGHVFDIVPDLAGNWVGVGALTYIDGTDDAVFWYAIGGSIATPGDWTQVIPGPGFLSGVVSDHIDTFVMVGRGDDPAGGAISYTADTSSLTAGAFPGPVALALHSVATDHAGTWIAVGYDTGGGPMRTYTSTDNGLNWTDTSSPEASGILLGVAFKVLA